jgi:plastocyanin
VQSAESTASKKVRTPWTFNRLLLILAFADLVIALFVLGGFSISIFVFVGPFLIPAVVCTALLVWRPNQWFYLAAGIASGYLFILFLPFVITGLSNPANVYEFAGNSLGLVALFWALPAGVIGFWRTRKKLALPDARSGWRTPQGIYALAVVFVAVGAILASAIAYGHAVGTPTGGGFDFEPSRSVNVTTQNFAFSPMTLSVPLRTIVSIVVTNKDPAFHTFTYQVNGKSYSHDLLPGTTTKFLVFFDATGQISFWCIPHRSMGMTGTITVA